MMPLALSSVESLQDSLLLRPLRPPHWASLWLVRGLAAGVAHERSCSASRPWQRRRRRFRCHSLQQRLVVVLRSTILHLLVLRLLGLLRLLRLLRMRPWLLMLLMLLLLT